jgi:hypothetical protein
MDIIKFIKDGATVPNPNYKKGAKKGLSSLPVLPTNNIEDVRDPTDASARVISEQNYGLTYLQDEAERFSKNKAFINPINSREELEFERAKGQPVLEQLGNMLGQAVANEVVLGTIRGFSDIYDFLANIGNEENNDYTNAVSRQIEDWQNAVKDKLTIYTKYNDEGFHFNDFGWWMNGAVSTASTVSLMLPGLGVSKGVGLLGKIGNVSGKLGKLTRKGIRAVAGAKNTGRIFHTAKGFGEIGGMAFLSRTAENYQEAREVYNNVYNTALQQISNLDDAGRAKFYEINPEFVGLSDEEAAKEIASVSAGDTFKNDYWMLLMDIPQFKALSPLWKGTGLASKATTRAVRKANNEMIAKLTGRSAKEIAADQAAKRATSSSVLERIGNAGKNLWTSTEGLMLGEGVEEGFQGIQTARGEERGEMFFNPILSRKQLADYLKDESIWEQAFWGVAGGLLFQGAAKGIGRIGDKLRAKISSDDLTDEQMKALAAGENKRRVEEIYGRFKVMDQLNDRIDLINRGYDPYRKVLDDNGQDKLDANGNVQYEQFDSVAEAERLKSVAVDDFLTELTLNAVDNGNYELLKEFVSNPEFAKHFEEQGIQSDIFMEQEMLNRMDQIKEQYERAYYDIIDNTDAYNDWITRTAARDVVRKRLDIASINDRINALNQYIEESGVSDASHYEKIAKQRMINEKIKQIDKSIVELDKLYNQRKSLYSKQAYNREVNTLKKQKASLLHQLSKTNNLFDVSGFENEDIDRMLQDAQKYYDNFIAENVAKPTSFENLSESLQRSFYTKANYELYEQDLLSELPENDNTKKFYTELYEDKEAELVGIVNSKFTDAFNTITKYLRQQENPVEAVQHLLKDEITDRKLKNALDILQFGAYSRQAYNNALSALVFSEIAKRQKENESKAKVENENVSEAVADKIDKDTNVGQSSSTGEQQNVPQPTPQPTPQPIESQTSTPVEEIGDTTIGDETIPIVDEEQEILSEVDKQVIENIATEIEQQQILSEADDLPIYHAQNAAMAVKRVNNELFGRVLKDGVGSQAYQDFLQKVKDQMVVVEGNSQTAADTYAEMGIKLMLDIAVRAGRTDMSFRRYDPIAIKKLFDSISKSIGINPETLDSIYAGVDTENTDNVKYDNLKELFDNYVTAFNLKKSDFDGRVVINIRTLFKELTNLFDDANETYTSLLALYRDMATFVNSYKGNEYLFLNKNYLNKSMDDFINNLNAAKTERTIVSPFMHFKSTLSSENNFTIKGLSFDSKIDLINYARQKGVRIQIVRNSKFGPVSIGFGVDYKGIYYELGMLALVKGDKENKVLSRYETYKTASGKKYKVKLELTRNADNSISSNQDYIFDELVNNNDLYNLLADWYVKHNSDKFQSDNNTAFAQKHSVLSNINDIKKFLNNDIIRKFAKNNGINIDFNSNTTSGELRTIFGNVAEKASNIIFYSINNQVVQGDEAIDYITYKLNIEDSYKNYKNKMFDNFKQTSQLFDRLLELEKTNGEGASIYAELKSDDAGKIRYDSEKTQNANQLGIKGEIEKHPFVYCDGTKFIDEYGKEYKGIPGMSIGACGVVMGENQGDRIIDNNGNVTITPGVNIALISESNKVADTSPSLRDATKNYIINTINDYYSVIKDKTIGREEKDKAFLNLYNTLNDLFGNTSSKLFGKYFVAMNRAGDRFAIYEDNGGKIGDPVASFFKYVTLEKKDGLYYKDGKVVSEDKLSDYFVGGIYIQSTKEAVFGNKKAEDRKKLYELVKYVTDNMIYNATRFVIDKKMNLPVESKHIKVTDKGKIYFEVGEYTSEEFDTFADAIVNLNMFKFTQVGSRYDNRYEYSEEPESFFLDISQETTPVTEEQLREDKGINGWLKENNIPDNSEVSTNEVIDHINPSDVSNDVKREIKALNDLLASQGTPLFTDKVRINANIKAYARYEKGEIIIGKSGVNLADSRGGEMIRLLIHENIHRIVKEEKFFNGKEGKRRLEELQSVFNQFYNHLSDDLSKNADDPFLNHITNTFNGLLSKYGEQPRILMDEFMAEVISDGGLRDYLNNIKIDESISINNIKQEKTLLQKILELICELFNKGNKINDDTLLAKFYESLGNVTLENSSSSTNFDVVETAKGAIEISPVKEDSSKSPAAEPTPEPPGTPGAEPIEETQDDAIDDDNETEDDIYGDDDFELLSEYKGSIADDYAIESFDKDKANNANGLYSVPDMDTFIRRFPSDERASMQAELTAGRIKYACR